MRSDIGEGGTFPDYELADQFGRRRSLSELQGGNPMVLHLSRGGFDPKEHQFVRRLVEVYPEFRNAYTRLALISTDNQLNINEFRDALGATWPFLSDPDRVVQKDLDIKEFTAEPHDPMIPHTFVLEPGLKIFKIYNGYWYWGRPTMAELHVDLRGVFKKIRPDFDLALGHVAQSGQHGPPQIDNGVAARIEQGAERQVEHDQDHAQRERDDPHQPGFGLLHLLELAAPDGTVRRLEQILGLLLRFGNRAGQVAAADAELDRDQAVALLAASIRAGHAPRRALWS